MEYKGINEAWEEYSQDFEKRVYMQHLSEKQRERDFREGYMRGFEMYKKMLQYPTCTEKKKVYEYKDNQYVLKGVAEMKNPETRKWQNCHIYVSLSSGLEYVRESEEFLKLFKEVK